MLCRPDLEKNASLNVRQKTCLRHSDEVSVAVSRLCDAFSRAAGMIIAIFLFKQCSVHRHSKTFHKFLDKP